MAENITSFNDVKGHVASIGLQTGGARSIDFDIRHGHRICLLATDADVIVRAEQALTNGECIEIFYEENMQNPRSGILFHIC